MYNGNHLFWSLTRNEWLIKRKYWADFNQLKRNQDWLIHLFINSTSKMPLYKNGQLYRSGKNHERTYDQYCMWCDSKFNNLYWKNGRLNGVHTYLESLRDGSRKVHFLCSKKCYDAVRASKKRNPDKYSTSPPSLD